MKNKMPNNTTEHVAAENIDLNTKFKWSDGLAEDLLKALIIFRQ